MVTRKWRNAEFFCVTRNFPDENNWFCKKKCSKLDMGNYCLKIYLIKPFILSYGLLIIDRKTNETDLIELYTIVMYFVLFRVSWNGSLNKRCSNWSNVILFFYLKNLLKQGRERWIWSPLNPWNPSFPLTLISFHWRALTVLLSESIVIY